MSSGSAAPLAAASSSACVKLSSSSPSPLLSSEGPSPLPPPPPLPPPLPPPAAPPSPPPVALHSQGCFCCSLLRGRPLLDRLRAECTPLGSRLPPAPTPLVLQALLEASRDSRLTTCASIVAKQAQSAVGQSVAVRWAGRQRGADPPVSDVCMAGPSVGGMGRSRVL